MLYNNDDEFKKIFKMSADFSGSMDRSKRHIMEYAGFIHRMT